MIQFWSEKTFQSIFWRTSPLQGEKASICHVHYDVDSSPAFCSLIASSYWHMEYQDRVGQVSFVQPHIHSMDLALALDWIDLFCHNCWMITDTLSPSHQTKLWQAQALLRCAQY